MSSMRVLGAVLLAGASLLGYPGSRSEAQVVQGTYEVSKGEGLYSIGGKLRYEGATRFQAVIAIFRANPDVFPDGNINVLREGQVLRIPSREEVLAIVPTEASRQWQSLTSKATPHAPPVIAAVKPAPAPTTSASPPATAPMAAEAAAKRYWEGLGMERRGDHQGALAAFLEAGEAGHGLSQRKLGQIYDKGNAVVPRDYQMALKWYQKARDQGVDIDKPVQRTSPR